MLLIKRYIYLLFIFICSICAFSQTKERAEIIYIPYGDTISQELIDYINNQTGKYILSYHPDMAHLIPEMRCRRIPDPCKTIEVNGVKFNMMCVEGGAFMMGAADDDAEAARSGFINETPAHFVTLSDYMIGQTEVTQELWCAVMGSNPSKYKGDKLPVGGVSWVDCQIFISKLNFLTGLHFRLPTEAEWEFAARGGNKSRTFKYAGSNDIDKVAWYYDNCQGEPHVVATKMSNELGIYDMSGNVWEFCCDWQADYSDVAQINPIGTIKSNYRICRGGGYENRNSNCSKYCRVSQRAIASPDYIHGYVGLRLVLDVHEYVDLGLSVMWATSNVGATAPEEYGDYFAWGETEPKEEYKWENYRLCNGTETTLTKYCSNSKYGDNGFVDNKIQLDLEDDAAHVNWGAMWRMATKAEFQELIDNCRWESVKYNGVKGYKITSTISGYTDRSIFLPCAGFHNDDLGNNSIGSTGRYWTSNGTSSSATNLWEGKLTGNTRRCGFSIRPVLPTERAIQTYKPIPSKRLGVFSVAKDRQVSFSQGNLIYLKIKDQWKFADNQWDYTGERHLQNGEIADTVMYFGWSAKDSKASWGISLSTKQDYYKGEFLDWGTNKIQGDKPNVWRTMSNDELLYLFTERKNADQLLGRGKVGDINGVILLPDEWVLPEGLQFAPISDDVVNTYTFDQWDAMESAGAVFIPATGYFNNKLEPKMRFVDEYAYMVSNTLKDSVWQLFSAFTSTSVSHSYIGTNSTNLYYAFPRRLVHDTIVPPPTPCETFEVNGVTFNMMCVEGGTFRMGKRKDEHQVTLSDYYIGETEVTQGLWKAVMAVDKLKGQNVYGDDYPVANISLSECETFVQRLSQLTGRKFRIPTEAEWEYAARGGRRSKGFIYSGSDSIGEVAWYKDNMTEHQPHPVAQLKPNELGVYDMSGNMAEWVSDWCAPYNLYPQINPTGAVIYDTTLSYHLIYRGGCWTQPTDFCEPTYRSRYYRAVNGIGLRLAMSDEEPFRAVYLNDTTRFYLRFVEGEKYDYYIGQTEVTQGLWKAVMGYNNSLFQGDNLPVEKVSWDECQLFVRKLNELTGLHFRLPTEAEWEYAARGGNRSRGYTYAGSNHIDSVGWYSGNSEQTTHAVASLMPNELGVYDMTGNVWEWCQDWHGEYLDGNNNRVIRGGSWYNGAHHEILTYRHYHSQESKSHLIGLRLVMDSHEYVDLGLSVMWATSNVGATAPEEYGDYFAWGETELKEEYSWINYKWSDGSEQNITKYNATDGLTTLLPEDDAAHVNWGGGWRMPSDAELTELRNYCSWEWTSINGENGYRVTGPNGNSIFFPAAGFYYVNGLTTVNNHGDFWSNSCTASNIKGALHVYFYSNQVLRSTSSRYYGFPIRPVLSKSSKTYYYGLTDEQFNMATSVWNMPNRGWGIADQTAIQGKILHGIRLKVHTTRVLHIYKVPSLTETAEETFVKVATVTATTTGVQNIDFDQPFYLGKDEYLVISSPSDEKGLVGYFSSGEKTLQPFYNRVGQSGGQLNSQSLMVDFY